MEDSPDPAAHTRQEEPAADSDQSEMTVLPADGCSKGELDEPNVENGALDLDGSAADHDCTGAQQDEEPTMKEDSGAGEDQPEDDEKAPEDTTAATESNTNPDHIDGPVESLQEDQLVLNTNCDDQKGSESRIQDPVEEEDPEVPRKASMEILKDVDRRNKVETIGPATWESADSGVTGILGGRRYLMGIGVVLVLVAVVVQRILRPEPPPPRAMPPFAVFLRQLERVESRFPGQRPELWTRSRIHLKRHLLTERPSQPVSLILTAGASGRRTLRCLARDLGSAFSSALNGSVLHIDGASKAGVDSDRVKLDIDGQLQVAFEGDKPVAVIHHFEQLPPGSTLIFYRYCDHENAAYKKTFLIFTVLLEGEEEIPAGIPLSAVEEMVDDHLQSKFLSHGRPLAFDRMDLDKYSGLWSRISHLILPVAAEAWTEHESCS
ncbi:torsin-1A-interacting protein 2-like isoform 1-T1 [Syngnathus typhle]